jgi:IMP dehydrogenase
MKNEVLDRAARDGVALTFGDVRLRTGYSDFLPHEADITTRFSKNVALKIPIVSSPMDKVTEARMGIELAKFGGLGIIHRGLNPEDQARQVRQVKNHLHGKIPKPTTVYADETVSTILEMCDQEDLQFRSFPVLDRERNLVGIITNTDFEFCRRDSINTQTAKDIMSEIVTEAGPETSLPEAYDIMHQHRKKALPLIQDGKLAGMYVLSDVKRVIEGKEELYNLDASGRLRVGAAVGILEDAYQRTQLLVDEKVDVIVIDTSHANSKNVVVTLENLSRDYLGVDFIAGNVTTGDSIARLVNAGAKGIRIGQGPGSICTTRIVTGIGSPQVSAIYECAKAAQDCDDVPLCADGGLKYPGDIPIAIAAGAQSVMMGSMLAGVDESPGEKRFFKGKQWKDYRGMGSLSAMQENRSSRERYGQKNTEVEKVVPEGVEGLVPYVGSLSDVLVQYVGGLRGGMAYAGTRTISELRKRGKFHRITGAGLAESHPHDVQITSDSPNYPTGENGTE